MNTGSIMNRRFGKEWCNNRSISIKVLPDSSSLPIIHRLTLLYSSALIITTRPVSIVADDVVGLMIAVSILLAGSMGLAAHRGNLIGLFFCLLDVQSSSWWAPCPASREPTLVVS
jgi:hypothetical protein